MAPKKLNNKVLYQFAYVLVYGLMRQGMTEKQACDFLHFIPISDTSSLHRISMEHLLRGCSAIKQQSNNPLACIELGLTIRLEDYGSLARTLSFFSTARKAIIFYNKMSWLLREPAAPKILSQKKDWVVKLNDTPEGYDFIPLIELNMAIMIALYQQVSGGFGQQYLKQINFAHALPEGLTLKQYEKLLGCSVKFDQQDNSLIIDSQAVDLPLHTSDQALLNSTKAYFDDLNGELNSQVHLSSQILHYIHTQNEYQLSIEEASDYFNLSVSTLKRRLKEEQTHFQQILDQARIEQATQLLDHSSKGITEISEALGYLSPASFSRAFKRWMGKSAREYRGE